MSLAFPSAVVAAVTVVLEAADTPGAAGRARHGRTGPPGAAGRAPRGRAGTRTALPVRPPCCSRRALQFSPWRWDAASVSGRKGIKWLNSALFFFSNKAEHLARFFRKQRGHQRVEFIRGWRLVRGSC